MKMRSLMFGFLIMCCGAMQAQDEMRERIAKAQTIADELPSVLDGLRNGFDTSKELIFQMTPKEVSSFGTYAGMFGVFGLLREMSSEPYTTGNQEKCRMLAHAWVDLFITGSSSCGKSKIDDNVTKELLSNLLRQMYGEKYAECFSKCGAALSGAASTIENSIFNDIRPFIFKFYKLLRQSFNAVADVIDGSNKDKSLKWDNLTEQQTKTLLMMFPCSIPFNTCLHCFGGKVWLKDSFNKAVSLSFRLIAGMPLKEVTAQELKDYFSMMYPVYTEFMDKADLEKFIVDAKQDAEVAKEYDQLMKQSSFNRERQKKAIEAVFRFCK